MGRIIAVESVTLDGVMQAPGRLDEDARGGFAHGGWAVPYGDEVTGRAMGESMATTTALLFGRRTWEDFAAFWPKQTEPNPFTDRLNRTTKYVASTTLSEPLSWENSTLLAGELPHAVAALKSEVDGDIVILGSGALVRSLLPHDLIDEFLLLVHPLLLGSGQKLFPEGYEGSLALVDSQTTTTGVVIGRYRPAEEPLVGTS